MRQHLQRFGPALLVISGCVLWGAALAANSVSHVAPRSAATAQKKSALRPEIPAIPAAALTPLTPAKVDRQAAYSPTGEKACLDCHDSAPSTLIHSTPHWVKADGRTPLSQHECESCHGASPEHIADPQKHDVAIVFSGKDASPLAERNGVCLTCHESGLRTHWAGSQHESRGVSCTDCHTLHATEQKVLNKATQAEVCFTCHKEQRAQVRRLSAHPLAITSMATTAKMACSDCHNPHGSVGPKLLIKASVNETCYTCHAEKRGPFLWEHAPVTDDCTNCHTPHGSVNPSLLKTRPPLLCQECHTGDHAAQVNSGANLGTGGVTTVGGLQQPGAASPRAQMAARACLNCHVLIHGSNHPAGAKFQR